ncbi:MAG: circularly permuted type 2 ATP-grasp protein, partial [Rubrivivax sp.]
GAALDALMRHAPPPEAGVWDEMRQADGRARPLWARFAGLAGPGGADALDAARRRVDQRLRLDGVTHNVFSADGVAARPWSLELLPMLVDPADWALIEAGVLQRAALLEAMLVDLYGPRRLLHEGLLPPALLLRHPGYLRALHGVVPAGGQHLHIVAFDVARGPDGCWWLVAQRTQGPSGLGYVLHNRLVVAREFPDAFRELRVQHLASSYRRLIDALEQRAREVAGGQTPRVVLLTPGIYAETYFEHAYLARYLGVPLVEGGDLTVRGDHLYLKTVEGLEPVHGVLRRVDDDWCDPLELRSDSALGVPGLLRAARAGHVVLANALGSAILETPALLGFLPAIARRLLHEELRLPALATWWCGEPAAWSAVRDRVGDKVLRSTFPVGGRTSEVHSATQVDIGADPGAWTVQGRLAFSRVPLWHEGRAVPRPAMLRVYAIADAQGRWHVLPGGMTRAAPRSHASLSMQRGGSSLDTWVMTTGRVDVFSMLPRPLQVDDIPQRRRPVSSRTGENLFWLGRYTERTEQLVRLAQLTLGVIDADNDAGEPVLQTLSDLAVVKGLAPDGVPTLRQSPQVFERAVLAAIGDAQGAASVAFNLQALARASQSLRERLSSEQWGLIRTMGESFGAAVQPMPGELPSVARVLPALDRLALQLAAVTGTQTDRMTRDHGWRLLAVGRLLERLIGITTRFETFLTGGALASAAGIDLLLELFDSAITFRARYQRHEDLLALTDLLVLDSSNPRAYAGVLRRLRTELSKLPGSADSLQPLLTLLPATGAGLTLEELRGADDAQIAERLLALSQSLGAAAWTLAEAIAARYFTLADEAHRFQHV